VFLGQGSSTTKACGNPSSTSLACRRAVAPNLTPDSTLVRAGPAMRNARRNAPWYRLSAPNLMNCFGMSSRESGQSLVPDPPARTRQWMSFKSTTPVE